MICSKARSGIRRWHHQNSRVPTAEFLNLLQERQNVKGANHDNALYTLAVAYDGQIMETNEVPRTAYEMGDVSTTEQASTEVTWIGAV